MLIFFLSFLIILKLQLTLTIILVSGVEWLHIYITYEVIPNKSHSYLIPGFIKKLSFR